MLTCHQLPRTPCCSCRYFGRRSLNILSHSPFSGSSSLSSPPGSYPHHITTLSFFLPCCIGRIWKFGIFHQQVMGWGAFSTVMGTHKTSFMSNATQPALLHLSQCHTQAPPRSILAQEASKFHTLMYMWRVTREQTGPRLLGSSTLARSASSYSQDRTSPDSFWFKSLSACPNLHTHRPGE